MGIDDRDYIRNAPAGGSAGSGCLWLWRSSRVTNWLILICIVVFIADRLGPALPVEIGGPHLMPGVERLPADAVRDLSVVRPQILLPDGRVIVGNIWIRHVRDSRGRVIGWYEYARMEWLTSWFHFSTARGFLGIEFWRFITFQFLHANIAHLLLNMLALFIFGPIAEEALGGKRYLAFYLLCGIFGAIMYLTLNLAGYVVQMFVAHPVTIPGLLFNDPRAPLIGASAGVFGVIMAGAFLAPRDIVYLLLFIPLRIKWVAWGLVALSLFTLITGGPNAGGEAGHLGGAIAGFYFIRHQHHLHGFFDFLGYADPTSHHYRKKKTAPRARAPSRPTAAQIEIDRILDKISREGLDSLTSGERETLRAASRR